MYTLQKKIQWKKYVLLSFQHFEVIMIKGLILWSLKYLVQQFINYVLSVSFYNVL